MKKLLAIFAVLSLAFLASCGDKTENKGGDTKKEDTKKEQVKTEETKKEDTASKGSCDSYLAYMECTYKKAGMDETTMKNSLDQIKAAWKTMDASKMEETCKQTIELTKKQPLVDGCSL